MQNFIEVKLTDVKIIKPNQLTVLCTTRGERRLISIRYQMLFVESKLDGQLWNEQALVYIQTDGYQPDHYIPRPLSGSGIKRCTGIHMKVSKGAKKFVLAPVDKTANLLLRLFEGCTLINILKQEL